MKDKISVSNVTKNMKIYKWRNEIYGLIYRKKTALQSVNN